MTIALLSLTFQGEPSVVGALDPEVLREAQRESFPRSPRRDALADPTYCAYKCAPLRSGHWLLSVARNTGAVDAHGRPALQTNACVLERAAAAGTTRDPVAVWAALKGWTPDQSLEAFLAVMQAGSAWESEEVFARFHGVLEKETTFFAALAAALVSGKATIGSGGEDVVEALRPALLLLPASRLWSLELATGSIEAEGRESCLVTAFRLDVPEEQGRLLGGLLKRRNGAVVADLRERRVSGVSDGPLELVRAIVDRQEWPGFSARERFRVLMESLDSSRGAFDVSPQLQAMRETVRKVEKLSHELESWK